MKTRIRRRGIERRVKYMDVLLVEVVERDAQRFLKLKIGRTHVRDRMTESDREF